MFLSMISIDSCMIIHNIAEQNIFVVIVYMLSLQNKYYSDTLKITLNLMKNKRLRCLRKMKPLNSENFNEK